MSLPTAARAPRPAPVPAGPDSLTRRAKAAIVVQFLIEEGADISLSSLPQELQVELTQQLGALRYIDRETLKAVMAEFADEIDAIGLRFPGGVSGALNALEGRLDPTMERRLRKETGAQRDGDPWDRISQQPAEKLAALADAESAEVAAVLLSKISTTVAAEVLEQLPGEKARRIAYAVSQTALVTPEAVARIGKSLASQIEEEPLKAFEDKPENRVGAILNCAPGQHRDEVLEGLEATDLEFANRVRKVIFTFANIPERVKQVDMSKIPRDVDQEMLVVALAGATSEEDAAAADYILGGLSKRMGQTLRNEVADIGQVTSKQAENAQGLVVAALREMADRGEIEFKDPDEEA